MHPQYQIDCILAKIRELWNLNRNSAFITYLKSVTHTTFEGTIEFDGFYIEEMCDGNVVNGDLFSFNGRSWMMNDTIGCTEITNTGAINLLLMKTTIVNGTEFYRVPIIKFFLKCNKLILGESFGPFISVRKICDVAFLDGGCRVLDTRIAWSFPTP